MGIDNGFTEGKSQAETPPAVSDFIRPAVKHVKDMGLYLIGNPRSVVRNTYNDLILSLLRKNFYFRSLRRVLNGIVHDIDNDLYDQPGIHLCKNEFLTAVHRNFMFDTFPVDMMQRLRNHFIHQLRRYIQIHPPFLDPCHRQKIFNQIDEPHGIIINICIHLLLCQPVEIFSVRQQIARIS